MNKSLLTFVLVSCFCHLCSAQIGETVDQLSHRYGPAKRMPLGSAWRGPGGVDAVYFFYPDDFKIAVQFKNGKAVKLQYIKTAKFTKRGKRPMTDNEIDSILRAAVRKGDWILISGNDGTRRWQTRDSMLFAYYFGRTPTRWWGPSSALWIQTASVDAAYQAEEERRRVKFQQRGLTKR